MRSTRSIGAHLEEPPKSQPQISELTISSFTSTAALSAFSAFQTFQTIFMATLSVIVGIVGNIISILVFLAPVGTFKRVLKKKSTEGFKGLPYVCTLLSTTLWTFYGLLKPGGLLIVTVNGAGAVLQAIYVTLYIIFAPKDKRVKYLKLVAALDIVFLALVISVVLFAIHGNSLRLTIVGILCAGLTLGMYASPLAVMTTVVKTRSVEYMPFFLSFFLFLNGGAWFIYSILVKDFYIGVPNGIGFVLGTAQLILYAVYKNMSKSTEKMEEEEGSARLVGKNLELSELSKEKEREERNLSKGRSLPKTSVTRQLSFHKILKAHSLTPYEMQSTWVNEEHVDGDQEFVGHGDTKTSHQV